MPTLVLQSLSRLSSIFPVSCFESLVLKGFMLAHRQEWQEFTCTRQTFPQAPPAPISQPVLSQEPHMLRSLLETDPVSVFTSSWWRKFSTWERSEIYQGLYVGRFSFFSFFSHLWSSTELKCLRRANHRVHWGHFFPTNSNPTENTQAIDLVLQSYERLRCNEF